MLQNTQSRFLSISFSPSPLPSLCAPGRTSAPPASRPWRTPLSHTLSRTLTHTLSTSGPLCHQPPGNGRQRKGPPYRHQLPAAVRGGAARYGLPLRGAPPQEAGRAGYPLRRGSGRGLHGRPGELLRRCADGGWVEGAGLWEGCGVGWRGVHGGPSEFLRRFGDGELVRGFRLRGVGWTKGIKGSEFSHVPPFSPLSLLPSRALLESFDASRTTASPSRTSVAPRSLTTVRERRREGGSGEGEARSQPTVPTPTPTQQVPAVSLPLASSLSPLYTACSLLTPMLHPSPSSLIPSPFAFCASPPCRGAHGGKHRLQTPLSLSLSPLLSLLTLRSNSFTHSSHFISFPSRPVQRCAWRRTLTSSTR